MSADPSSLFRSVNEAQRRASNPLSSVWVSASAGSGKTKVLADRVTRLLLEGVPPTRILCLTFTRAAAAEMSIRLTQRLSVWATCQSNKLDEELDKLLGRACKTVERDRARRLFAHVLACPGGMRIQTIHAFAQEILRRFPLEAGLAPHFAVMEEAEAQSLRRDAFTDMLESAAEGRDPEVAEALRFLAPRMNESKLESLLADLDTHAEHLLKALEHHGDVDGIVAAQRAALSLGPDETEETLIREACAEEAFDRAALTDAARILDGKASVRYAARGRLMLDWLEQEDTQGRERLFAAYMRAFLKDDGEPYAIIANKEILESSPAIVDVIGREAVRMMNVKERVETIGFAQEGAAILRLGNRLKKSYDARKTALAALDYDDLIEKTNNVLARPDIAPWVLFKLDGGIDHILLDESQDTNPAQWRIVETLANEYFAGESARTYRGERTLFVVGDEKQSIYSFLKADPEAFERMRAHFAARIRGASKPFDEVPLNVSFRSAPAILRAVDAVFGAEAARNGVSRMPVCHQAARAEGAGRVEVWPLVEKPEDDAKPKGRQTEALPWGLPLGYEAAHDPAAMLAVSLADQIRLWLVSGQTVYDRGKKAERPMNPGDIMVLVQRRGAFVEHFVRALKDRGVAVSGVDRMHLTDQLAVMDLLALVQFALLPEDDLTLATILRGPLIGATEPELENIAAHREGTLWHSLQVKAATTPRYAQWRNYLTQVSAQADVITPLALLIRILTQPCPADERSGRRALAARLGPDAEDALDELLNVAEAFEARHAPSLQAFSHWIMSADVQVKRELEQAVGRVRITTVHASKGLEAPVVILPDTVRVPERQRLSNWAWDEVALIPFYVPRDPAHAHLAALRGRAYDKQLEEYRRLLYVALTRAADRLYVAGFKGDKTPNIEHSWYALVENGLKPHHQDAAMPEGEVVVQPRIVLADYALTAMPLEMPEAEKVVGSTPDLPTWAFAPPAPEPLPPRPLVPSRPSEEEPPSISPQDARFTRGKLLHRLLESLPDVPPEKQQAAARRFLANPQHGLEAVQQEELTLEALALLRDERFAPLFGPDSKAEVPVVGLWGERLISGQVDRLALVGQEVWIIDYKTNRPPPVQEEDIPAAYRAQMEAYRAVLAAVYPGRRVRCFLLWTYVGRITEILPRA